MTFAQSDLPKVINEGQSRTRFNFVGICLGSYVILLAALSFVTQMNLAEIYNWIEKYFSASFLVGYVLLVFIGGYAGLKVTKAGNRFYWFEVGQQCASGIATLALTYTLLGISLGIGSLSEHTLTPETIPALISGLTKHFSTAFFTTIIGLPTSNALRAFIGIRHAAVNEKGN